MPRPLTMSRMTLPWPCLCLMIAVASPVGVDEGWIAPSWVAVPLGVTLGTIASAGRSVGPLTWGAVVVVVSSLGLWSFSGLVVAVVVGAGAAGVAGWVADGITAAGAVEVGVAGWAVVGVVAGGCVGGGSVVAVVLVVVVALGSMTRTTPHIPSSWPLLSEPSWLKLE